jgi:hypothetical protein
MLRSQFEISLNNVKYYQKYIKFRNSLSIPPKKVPDVQEGQEHASHIQAFKTVIVIAAENFNNIF